MSDYPSPELLLQLLRRSGHRTIKSLGQHFMTDDAVLQALVDALRLDGQTLAVEIGPGPCTLTTLLASVAGGVVAIEKDPRLQDFHSRIFAGRDRIEILYRDALRVDLPALVGEYVGKWGLKRAVLTGNLPYQITSPLLFGQIGPDQPWSGIVVMIQKEVADRILAGPHSRDYGILTVKLAFWWSPRRVMDVPAALFNPPPKVDGTILAFEPPPHLTAWARDEWPAFSKFVDLCFNQRRKKLYNSPAAARFGKAGPEHFRAQLTALGLGPDVRAEDLSPDQFLLLFRALNGPPLAQPPLSR